jgi:hypothetical protein
MTIYIDVLTNYVPAVAAIHKRLALFIFNRFKGYPGGEISLNKVQFELEFDVRRSYLWSLEIKFFDTIGTGKGESNLLCKN